MTTERYTASSAARAIAGTLQLPFPRAEMWRERLSEPPEGLYSLVGCVDDEVVGSLSLETSPHAGSVDANDLL
jgi:hypothetical protein